MRTHLLLFALGLCAFSVLGQPRPGDTSRVNALLDRSIGYVNRPGNEKKDIDSAVLLAEEALALSRKVGYPHGIQNGAYQAAVARMEARDFSAAWSYAGFFDDTSRANFYGQSIDYRLNLRAYTRAEADSTTLPADLLIPLLPKVQSARGIGIAYPGLAGHFKAVGDRKRSAEYALQGLQLLRKAGSVFQLNDYLERMAFWYHQDSAFASCMYSMVAQVEADAEARLPALSDIQQHDVIARMAYIVNIFYYGKQLDAVMRMERVVMRLNERLHQHVSLPYSVIAYLYNAQARTKEALPYALDAVRVTETPLGPVDGKGYECASLMYLEMENLDKSMQYFYKALPLYQKDPSLIGNPGGLFSRAIGILLRQQKPDEALRLLGIVRRPPPGVIFSFNDKAFFAMSAGDCYSALGRKDAAEQYYSAALKEVPQDRYTPTKVNVYERLATFYTANRQYARARPLLDTLLADSIRPLSTVGLLAKSWLLRYQGDSALGNYRQAMSAIRNYQFLHDSLTNIAKNKQLAEMDVQYETEKKNQHIAHLEEQSALQARLQQSTLRQEHLVRNSLIAGAALLALLAAVLYNRYRIKQRMTRRLEKLSTRQQKLIKDKEWLLREIHHRVKNNLQIIISLLRLQSGQLKDEAAIGAFEEISARVNAISLVHKKLYQEGQNMASIDMRDYIKELVDFLKEGFSLGSPGRRIGFRLDIGEVYLDVAQCVPLGLILNEAITNAIKYAFPPGRPDGARDAMAGRPDGSRDAITDHTPSPPLITIALHEQPGHTPAPNGYSTNPEPAGQGASPSSHGGSQSSHPASPSSRGASPGCIRLLIADNGIGLPTGIDPETNGSLGLQLIYTLTQQLEGTLAMTNDPGLTIRIQFSRGETIAG